MAASRRCRGAPGRGRVICLKPSSGTLCDLPPPRDAPRPAPAVEDGVGVSRVADEGVPFVDGDLAGEEATLYRSVCGLRCCGKPRVHEAIGHTCEADNVLSGSIAADWLGQPVAAEKVTLGDYGERGPDGKSGLAIHVDDEGTPCRDVIIIENGVLKAFLHNKDTARQLGAEPTGNARAFAFSDEPLVRMRNTAIMPGLDRLGDMIAAVDRGYYLKRVSNGQADWTSEFMFGITCG